MTKGKKGQQTKSRSQRKDDVERKRDDRARRAAFKKERESREYYPLEDDADYISFNNQLLSQGLKIKDIPGDGNCLFRSLADQLEGDHEFHKKVRAETVKFMHENEDDFAPFIDVDRYSTFSAYLENLGKDGTFAGNDAIVAFTRNQQVDVVIHQFNNPRFVIQGNDSRRGRKIELHIAYHNGEHYSSLRRLNDPGSGPAYPYHGSQEESSDAKLKSSVTDAAKMKKKPSVLEPTQQYCTNCGVPPGTKLTENEQLVISGTKCMNVELVQKAIADYQDDVDAAISHVLQVMCLTDGNNASNDPEARTCASPLVKVPSEQGMDGDNELKYQKEQAASSAKKTRTAPKKNTRSTQLSNRQRKELAKQEKKTRREETQRQQHKEKSAKPESEAESGLPKADVGSVHI